ncbi:DUF7684 family protein [Ruegeria halocynthiae]
MSAASPKRSRALARLCSRAYPEEKFVMTSWHDEETLEEAVEFARHCTK